MTHAYIPMRLARDAFDALEKELPKEILNNPEYKAAYAQVHDEKLAVACRLFRYFYPKYKQLNDLITAELGMSWPFTVLAYRDGENLVVFPRLKFDTAYAKVLETLTTISYPSKVIPQIIEDMKHNEEQFKTLRRTISALKRREVLTFSKAIARYGNRKYTADGIAHLNEQFLSAIKGFEVIFCKTPEDYVKMYEGGGIGSCMVTTSDHSRNWRWMLKEHGINPASFYHYHPATTGAYVMRDGKVIARTLVYDTDGKKYHGRIYSQNEEQARKLVNSLAAHGYNTPINARDQRAQLKINCKFTIPGRLRKGLTANDYFMPFPYIDNIAPPCIVSWNKETKEFTVEFNQNTKGNVSTQSTEGYLTSRVGEIVRCAHCNNPIAPGRVIQAIDGTCFDRESCVVAANYVRAIRNDGVPVYTQRNQDIFVGMDGTAYTNFAAAQRAGSGVATQLLGALGESHDIFYAQNWAAGTYHKLFNENFYISPTGENLISTPAAKLNDYRTKVGTITSSARVRQVQRHSRLDITKRTNLIEPAETVLPKLSLPKTLIGYSISGIKDGFTQLGSRPSYSNFGITLHRVPNYTIERSA